MLVGLTSWPTPPDVPAPRGTDKVVHLFLYATLAWLVIDALPASNAWTPRRMRQMLLVVAGTSAFGWVDEWHQQFIPGRSRDTRDWLADTAGAAAAAAIGLLRPARRLA